MISLTKSIDLTGYTAIIPSIGVGNVAQLAMDLIIATLKLERIGNGWHTAMMPIFGPPAYQHDNNNKTTSCELYADEKNKLVVFQFRSPFVVSQLSDFHQQLVKFLVDQKFSNAIILTSSHAYEKHSIETTPFEYLANEQFREKYNDHISGRLWNEFKGSVIHGGGNAQKLLNVCTDKEIPCLVLFKYVSEGDNSPDASQLCAELNRSFKIFDGDSSGQVKLTIPVSWNLLFGNDPPELIF